MKALPYVLSMTLVGLMCITIKAQSLDITFATYNLRYASQNDGKNSWENRREMVMDLILYHELEILATQEGLLHQLEELSEMPDWNYIGAGRDDGKKAGEHCAIFYKESIVKLLDSGDFWLSETPDIPSKGWDATCCNRICSWAKFKHKQTGFDFYVFNVHFDHIGKVARVNSAYLTISKIREIAGDAPIILCGDFNSTPDTEQIKYISQTYQDAYQISQQKPYGPIGTFNGFKFEGDFNSRIDYIFVSEGFKVEKYAVLTDSKQNRYPSDHFPVVAKINWDR